MKKIILSITIVIAAFTSNAQGQENGGKFKVNAGVEFAVPIGKFNFWNPYGIGPSISVEHVNSKKLSITYNAAVIALSGRPTIRQHYITPEVDYSQTIERPSDNLFSLLVGVKYFFSNGVYGHFQSGFSNAPRHSGFSMAFAPSVGFMVSKRIDINFKLQSGKTLLTDDGVFSFLSIKGSYTF